MEYTALSILLVFFFIFVYYSFSKWSLCCFSTLSIISLFFFPPVLIHPTIDLAPPFTLSAHFFTLFELVSFLLQRILLVSPPFPVIFLFLRPGKMTLNHLGVLSLQACVRLTHWQLLWLFSFCFVTSSLPCTSSFLIFQRSIIIYKQVSTIDAPQI